MAKIDFPVATADGQVFIESTTNVVYTYVGNPPAGYWSAYAGEDSENLNGYFVKVAGDNMTGDLTLGTDKIKLNAADGSIEAADGKTVLGTLGTITLTNVNGNSKVYFSWTNIGGNAEPLFRLDSSTGDQVFTLTPEALKLGGTLPGDPAISLNTDGSASFAGVVDVGDYNSANGGVRVSNQGLVNIRRFGAGQQAALVIRDNNGNQKSLLYSDGTATFSGNVLTTNSSFGTGDDTGRGISAASNGLFQIQRPSTTASNGYALNVWYGATKTAEIQIDGTTRIGGTLPGDPAISLNADGRIRTEAGINTENFSVFKGSGSYAATFIRTSSTAASQSEVVTVSASDQSNVTVLNTNGVIETIGNIHIGGTLTNVPGTTNPNISLNANGSAEFAGAIKIKGPRPIIAGTTSAILGLETTDHKWDLYSNDTTGFIGFYDRTRLKYVFVIDNTTGNVGIGGSPPSLPNISLNADGSAEFAKSIEAAGGAFHALWQTGTNATIDNFCKLQLNQTGTNILTTRTALDVQQNGVTNVSIDYDGDAEFEGRVTAQRVDVLSNVTNGAGVVFAGSSNTTRTFLVNDQGTTQIGGILSGTTASNTPNIELNADGSITSRGYIYAIGAADNSGGGRIICGQSSSSTSTDRSGVTIQGQGLSDGGAVTIQSKSTYGTTLPAFQIFRGSTKIYAINYAGAASFSNVIFNLEVDDDTKYTATTNEEGETELVYNGAVLDVKDRLTKADAALVALKSAAAAATDFASLQSAIATALANI